MRPLPSMTVTLSETSSTFCCRRKPEPERVTCWVRFVGAAAWDSSGERTGSVSVEGAAAACCACRTGETAQTAASPQRMRRTNSGVRQAKCGVRDGCVRRIVIGLIENLKCSRLGWLLVRTTKCLYFTLRQRRGGAQRQSTECATDSYPDDFYLSAEVVRSRLDSSANVMRLFDAGIQSTRTMAVEMRNGWRRRTASGARAGVGIALLAAVFLGQSASAAVQADAEAAAKRFVVVLDAAHGGSDPGATLGAVGDEAETLEKNVTLSMSQRLRALLVARGFTVIETRESDVALDEDARATVVNQAQAQACIVLHASEAGSGVHLFVSSLPPMQPQAMVPWKTAQALRVESSLKLGNTLNSAFTSTGRDGESIEPIPVTLGRTTLPGIDSMICPAVAVEIAPLRDKEGKVVSEVTDADYQAHVLNALAAALLVWRSEAGEP